MDPFRGGVCPLVGAHGGNGGALDEVESLFEALSGVVLLIGPRLVEEDGAGIAVEVGSAKLEDCGKGEKAQQKGADAGDGDESAERRVVTVCVEGRGRGR